MCGTRGGVAPRNAGREGRDLPAANQTKGSYNDGRKRAGEKKWQQEESRVASPVKPMETVKGQSATANGRDLLNGLLQTVRRLQGKNEK